MRIPFLIDEDVPDPVGKFLEERSHDVVYVRDVKQGATDPEVMAMAVTRSAVIVSKNQRHFDKLNPRAVRDRLKQVGCVYLCCFEPKARKRIEEFIELIELEWRLAQVRPDKRVIVEIKDTLLRIIR